MDLITRFGLVALSDDEKALLRHLTDVLSNDEMTTLLELGDRIRSMERMRAALNGAA